MGKLEDNYRELAEYYKNLDKISYDAVVDKLYDKKNKYQISFGYGYDALNDKNYNVVNIWNNTSNTHKEYSSIDQDDNQIYNNLIKSLRRKEENLLFQVIRGYWTYELVYAVNDSYIKFPPKIVRDLMNLASDIKKENDVSCIIGNEEVFIPGSLSIEDPEKQMIIDKK